MCLNNNKARRQIMNYRNLISVLAMSVGLVFGQAVTGFVGNGEEPLVGANIVIEGTELGGVTDAEGCLLYTSPSPRDLSTSRMPSSA